MKLDYRFRFVMTTGLLLLSLLWGSGQFNAPITQAAGSISGNVFRDFNSNGVDDGASEPGIAGVTVTAYDAAGINQGTAVTDSNGDYALSAGGTGPYRIEFTAWPSYFQPNAQGSQNGSSVQFVPDGNSTANFALINPSDYSEPNPLVVVSRLHNGLGTNADPSNSTRPAILAFNYNNTGDTPHGLKPGGFLGQPA